MGVVVAWVGGMGMAILVTALHALRQGVAAAGPRLSQLLGRLPAHPVAGAVAGFLVAAVLHSSSATNLLALTLLSAGVLDLARALAVVVGANVGTTMTAQLMSLPVGPLAWPALVVGVGLAWAGKRPSWRAAGQALAGLGGLFFALQWLSRGLAPLLNTSWAQGWLATLHHSPWQAAVAGAILAAAVQSSTAVTGLVLALADHGTLALPEAVAVVLGANVGTVTTTLLGSLGAGTRARWLALADLALNAVGVTVALAAFPVLTAVASASAASTPRQVANAHTLFNLVSAVLVLPFIPPLTSWLRRWSS